MASIPGLAQWARWTRESTWGTFDGSATEIFWTRLESGQSLMLDGKPNPQTIRGADGGNLRQQQFSKKTTYEGSFETSAYPDLMVYLIPALCTPITVGSRKQLRSYTVDYSDGAEVRRALGVRLGRGGVTSDNGSDVARFRTSLQYQKLGTPPTLTEPAATVFSSLVPYCLQDAVGQVNVGGALSNFKSLSFTVNNILKANFNEQPYITGLDYCGRDVSFEVTAELASATRRALYENQTLVASGLFGWSIASPSHSILFDCQGNLRLTNRSVSRDFADNQYESLTLDALKDGSTGYDMLATAT